MTTDPLRQFEAEHEEALGVLQRLDAAALALEAGEAAAPHLAAVRAVHAILTTKIRKHNDDEEWGLFPLLEGLAPSELFEDEHRKLRNLEEELGRALDGPAPGQRVVPPALEIVELLRAHIAREDEVLFPMARALLGAEGLAEVARRLTPPPSP